MKYFFIPLLVLFLSACSDNAMVQIYEKNLQNVNCLRLVVFPPDRELEESFNRLYEFDKNCPFRLQVKKKSGITCNSNQNSQTKAIGGMPSSYLNLQLSKDSKKIYSYYIDLKEDVKEVDIQNALERMKKDLEIN